jgi:Flp pilus assembly protein TadD
MERNDSLVYVPLQTNELRYLLAAVKTMAGRPEEAVPLLREVASEDLSHFMAHVQLAEISQQVGLLEEALRHRQLAVQANPEDATLVSELGITLVRAGRPDEGIKTLAEAAALNPRDARPHYLLGLMELQRGNKEKAAAAFRQFIALAPKRYERQIADARQRLGTLE